MVCNKQNLRYNNLSDVLSQIFLLLEHNKKFQSIVQSDLIRQRIKEKLVKLHYYIFGGANMGELNKNEVLLDSMLFRMIQVSENAKKLLEIK